MIEKQRCHCNEGPANGLVTIERGARRNTVARTERQKDNNCKDRITERDWESDMEVGIRIARQNYIETQMVKYFLESTVIQTKNRKKEKDKKDNVEVEIAKNGKSHD